MNHGQKVTYTSLCPYISVLSLPYTSEEDQLKFRFVNLEVKEIDEDESRVFIYVTYLAFSNLLIYIK